MDPENLKKVFALVNKKNIEKNAKLADYEKEIAELKKALEKKQKSKAKQVEEDDNIDEDEKPAKKSVKAVKNKKQMSEEAKEALKERLRLGRERKKAISTEEDIEPEPESVKQSEVKQPEVKQPEVKQKEPEPIKEDVRQLDKGLEPVKEDVRQSVEKPKEPEKRQPSQYYLSLVNKRKKPNYF